MVEKIVGFPFCEKANSTFIVNQNIFIVNRLLYSGELFDTYFPLEKISVRITFLLESSN